MQPEQDGTLTPPVRRAFDENASSGGADFIDGDGHAWDVKDARGGPDKIAQAAAPKGGKPGESVLVDCSRITPEEQHTLANDLSGRLTPSGTGKIEFVRLQG